MNQCSSCGTNNPDPMKFCQGCGSPLEIVTTENQKRVTSKPAKAPLKKSNKIMAIVFAFILLAGGITHFTIKNQLDPYKQLTNANKAFVNNDYEAFLNYFEVDSDVVVDAKAFHRYMEDIQWSDKISPQLEDGIKKIDKGSFADAIVGQDGQKIMAIMDEKFLGIYRKYSVKIIPIEVTASTSLKTATITYGDSKKMKITDNNTPIGKSIPGVYKFSISVADDFSEKTFEEEQIITNNDASKQEIFFDFSEKAVALSSDYNDAIVFIDGKSTKKKANELKLFTLLLDGSATIHAEHTVDGQKKVSEKVKLDSNDIHIPFADVQKRTADSAAKEQKKIVDEAAKEELMRDYADYARNFYYDFRNSHQDGLNTGDFNYISNYFEDGSAVKRSYRDFVLEHRDRDFEYSYTFLANDIIEMKATSSNTFELTSQETFELYELGDEPGEWKNERTKLYKLKLINGSLYISSIENVGEVIKTRIS
ncbi:hypothetical protein [Lysinibacillus sp. NPDC059133]|uniref:TcaA 3rd/4th domain-containing protein n=1 Tax=Lysinibacillus sp. NPDC059133 TaxID=3346737 RepID=UPI00368D6E29